MKYLRIKKEVEHRIPTLKGYEFIAFELFTLKEAEKIGIKKEWCDEIEVSKLDVRTSFRVRTVKNNVVYVEKAPDGYFSVIRAVNDKLLLAGFIAEIFAIDWAEKCGYKICTLSHVNDNMQKR